MTQHYSGKRKAFSLVEMTIAVILFGLLSTIALIYYKNLYNIDLTAKKARVAALMDQGHQLSGAFDIYQAQFGVAPTSLLDFNATNVLILTDLPARIKEMSTTGWELNLSTGIPLTSGYAFKFPIDLNGTWATSADDDLYCAVYNHELNTSIELNVSNNTLFAGDENASYLTYGKTFCYNEGGLATGKHWIMIIK